MPEIFAARRAKREQDREAFQAQLYQQIGQLKVELDWSISNIRTRYYSVRRMTAWLRSQGYAVNHKRVARLLQTMGVEAI
jgi:helix-turn-helix protein